MLFKNYLKYDQDNNFEPDNDLFQKIESELNEKRVLILHGFHGVGKSSVANEYAYKLKDTHLIRWLNCESESKFNFALKQFSNKLGLDSNAELNVILTKLKSIMFGNAKIKFLFILDDVKCYETISEFVKGLPQNAFVIITTNDAKLNTALNSIEVKPLYIDKAMKLLKRSLVNTNLSDYNFNDIVESLTHKGDTIIPIELNLVATLLNEINSAELCKSIEKREANKFSNSLLLHFFKKSKNLWISISHLAYIDGDFIHKSFIEQVFGDKNDLQVTADKFQILKRVKDSENNEGFSINKIVQEKLVNFIQSSEYHYIEIVIINALIKLLNAEFTNLKNPEAVNFNKLSYLYNHAIHLIDKAPIIEDTQLLCEFFSNITAYQRNYRIDDKLSIVVETKLIEIKSKRSGEYSLDVACSYNNLADIYFNFGKYTEALSYYKTVLAIKKTILNKDHIVIAKTTCDIATTYLKMIYYQIAYAWNKKAFALIESNKESETSDEKKEILIKIFMNFGTYYFELLRLKEAVEWFNISLRLSNSLNTKNYFTNAECFNKIAQCFDKLGDLDKAVEVYNLALENEIVFYGRNGIKTAKTLNKIARLLAENRKPKEAHEYEKRELDVVRENYGAYNNQVAAIYKKFAAYYNEQDDEDTSLYYHKKLLDVYKRMLGKENRKVGRAYFTIGTLFNKKDRNSEICADYLKKSKDIFEKVYGNQHQLTALAYKSLGDCYLSRKEPDKAVKMFENSLEILKIHYGEKSIDVANCCLQIAKAHFGLKEHEKVSQFLQIATEIYDFEHRKSDIDVTNTFNLITSVYMQMKFFDKAIQLSNECIQMNKRNDMEILSKSYDNLASSYSSLNMLDEASEFYVKGLSIKKEKFGDSSLIVADEYETIGNCYLSLQKFAEAFESFKKSYEIYENLNADRNTKAICCINLIDCLEALNLHEDAIKWYVKSIEMFERKIPEKNEAREVGLNYLKKRKFSLQNAYYYEQYYDLLEKEKRTNDPELIKASKMKALYNALIGRKEKAIEWCVRVQKTDKGPLAYASRTGIILWGSFVDYLKFNKTFSKF